MMTQRLVAGLVAAVLCGGAVGADEGSSAVRWTNVVKGDSPWSTLSNWSAADGSPLTVVPTNGEDVVLPHLAASPFVKRITTSGTPYVSGVGPVLQDPAVNVAVGKLTGDEGWTIRVAEETAGGQNQLKRFFAVADPNGYTGFWEPGDGKTQLRLDATDGFVPKMDKVSAWKRPEVAVPTAGASAEVTHVTRAGALVKSGAGELSVRTFANDAMNLYVKEGALVFRDKDSGQTVDVAALIREAALDLDASAEETLTTVASNGQTCVTAWRCANGKEPVARPEYSYNPKSTYLVYEAHAPFVSSDRSPTGLPLVDFGAMKDESEELYGPLGCYFVLSSAVNVREMFAVIDSPRGMNGRTTISSGGNYQFMSEGSATIFCGYGGTECVYAGDIRIDNEHVRNDDRTGASLTGAYTFSVGVRDKDVPVDLIGTRERYALHTGGFRMGELLLFSRALSDAERNAVNAYLRQKWLRVGKLTDVQGVFVAKGATLGVESNAAVRVESLNVEGDLSLTGGGKLTTGYFNGTNVNLSAELAFDDFSEIDDSQPAGGAYVWLDATDDDTFTYNTAHGTDKDYVEAWKDRRKDVSVTATCPHKTPGMPFRVRDEKVGKMVVDFGRRADVTHAGTASQMAMPNWESDVSDTYAGFCVMRTTVTGMGYSRAFGSKGMSTYMGTKLFACSDYVNGIAASATVTVDGVPADPHDGGAIYNSVYNQTSEFRVVAFTTSEPLAVNMLTQDRWSNNIYSNYCGNMRIGEYILYHRRLSPAERRNTEAYLMKKWLGKSHPAATRAKALGAVAVSGEKAGLGANVPLDVESVSGALDENGTFVKSGSGTVRISSFQPENVSNLVVEAGTLEFAGSALADDSRFHFDAADTASFDTFLTDDGATTNVVHWADTRKNGLTTYCPKVSVRPGVSNGKIVFTNPVWRVVEMRPGVMRPVVDFGKFSGYYTNSQDAASAGLNMSLNGTSATRFTDIVEAFTVFSDGKGSGGYNFIFTDSTDYHYHRNGNWILTDNPGTKLGTKDGYHAVDGVEVAYNYALPEGFHVINFAPTNATSVGTLAIDRTSNGGGCLVAESIGFGRRLSARRRKFIERQLMHKWFDAPAPVWTNEYDTVAVASGATLRVGADELLSLRRIAGGGTLAANVIMSEDLAELSFGFRSAEDVDSLTVSGSVELTGDVTVAVDFAEGLKPPAGEWPLLTATGGLEGLDGVRLTLSSNLDPSRIGSLVVRGNTIYLKIEKRGSMLIVR